jgi:predicted nucleotidyltransferase/predicted transcriptional regulator
MEGKQETGLGFRSFGTMELSYLEGTIISSFFPEGKDRTIKELMKRVDYSYERVNSALKSLARKNIIKEKNVGKTLVYSIDLHNLYVEIGFSYYTLKREIEFIRKHRMIYSAIKEIMDNPFIWGAILFGSYSKGTETKQSDVDIICISNKKKEIESFIYSLKHKYGFNFSPVILPLYEFPNIKKDNPELWYDLKMYGLVFKGEDYFYSYMYKDDK